jgi:hypothetical protein
MMTYLLLGADITIYAFHREPHFILTGMACEAINKKKKEMNHIITLCLYCSTKVSRI